METMTQEKEQTYLSEALTLSAFDTTTLNLIETKPGTGKTYFALNVLPNLVERRGRIVYLIDHKAGVNQIVKNYPDIAQHYSTEWLRSMNAGSLEFANDKIVVMTYAFFGTLTMGNSEFIKNLEMVICDELHNIYWPISSERTKLRKAHPQLEDKSLFQLLDDTSANKVALTAIEELCWDDSCYVVGMTATPRLVIERFSYKAEINRIEPDVELVGYETKNLYPYRNLEQEIRQIKPGQKCIIYIPRIDMMEKFMAIAEECKLRFGGVWSTYNANHPMSDKQLILLDFLLENQRLPDTIDVLFINKSCETSINIYGDIDAIYVHCNHDDTITQVRGRYRDNLDNLYTYRQTLDYLVIPDEFLNVPLFEEDRDRLSEILNLRNANYRQYKWRKINEILPRFGYRASQQRKNNRSYFVITKTKNEPVNE